MSYPFKPFQIKAKSMYIDTLTLPASFPNQRGKGAKRAKRVES
jgi:hypothetical protein